MDISTIVSGINSVGFPICCVIAMFYLLWTEKESHAKESEKWVEALNRNTSVMEKVLEKLEG